MLVEQIKTQLADMSDEELRTFLLESRKSRAFYIEEQVPMNKEKRLKANARSRGQKPSEAPEVLLSSLMKGLSADDIKALKNAMKGE